CRRLTTGISETWLEPGWIIRRFFENVPTQARRAGSVRPIAAGAFACLSPRRVDKQGGHRTGCYLDEELSGRGYATTDAKDVMSGQAKVGVCLLVFMLFLPGAA